MNKSDLIAALAAKEKLRDKQATDVIKLIFSGFTYTLRERGRIEIRGSRSFSVREYETYTGKNPKTGSNVDVRLKKLPFFRAGKELKGKVNTGGGQS